jgi:hypothetical protein
MFGSYRINMAMQVQRAKFRAEYWKIQKTAFGWQQEPSAAHSLFRQD